MNLQTANLAPGHFRLQYSDVVKTAAVAELAPAERNVLVKVLGLGETIATEFRYLGDNFKRFKPVRYGETRSLCKLRRGGPNRCKTINSVEVLRDSPAAAEIRKNIPTATLTFKRHSLKCFCSESSACRQRLSMTVRLEVHGLEFVKMYEVFDV